VQVGYSLKVRLKPNQGILFGPERYQMAQFQLAQCHLVQFISASTVLMPDGGV
jgi:hypothetical protein